MRLFLLFLACSTVFMASCQSQKGKAATASPAATPASVETKSPNTDYKPAFAGQTRAPGVKTAAAWEGRSIATGLQSPWGLVALPDGRLLITQKGGTLRIATAAGALSEPIGGLPTVDARGQGGLLGLTLDPAFATNRMIFWVFSEPVGEGNLTSVARGTLSADDKRIEGATVIYRATPAYDGSLHFGGRILFDKEGYLMLCTGERSDRETRPQAQDLKSGLGKIIRITRDGQPAPGNPFAGKTNARPEVWSYGHRNPQGMAFHPATGELWEAEFGPRGGDELNRVQAGKNYGWPTITYGLEYSGLKVGAGITQQAGLEQPVYYWDPVLSPSGMAFYNGDKIPEWKNNLFICGLNSNHIARLILNGNKVVGEERLLSGERQRFRDITQGADGALYAVTDGGGLYRLGAK